jgi:feruloyl-CoA synthase
MMNACRPLIKDAVIPHDSGNMLSTLVWADASVCAEALPELPV